MPLKNISHKFNYWFAEKYGSRRGALLTYRYRILFLLGRYHQYRKINWQSIDRLVFVCKGNICRSAYAEAVAKSMGIEAISCGIDTTIGGPANEDAIKTAVNRGIDLGDHKTTTIQSLTFSEQDLVIAMEPWQAEYVLNNLPVSNVCTLLGLWGRPVTPHIHDPYGSSPVYFDKCFSFIEKSVRGIAKNLP